MIKQYGIEVMIKFSDGVNGNYKVFSEKDKILGHIRWLDEPQEYAFVAAWSDRFIRQSELEAIVDKLEILNNADARD